MREMVEGKEFNDVLAQLPGVSTGTVKIWHHAGLITSLAGAGG